MSDWGGHSKEIIACAHLFEFPGQRIVHDTAGGGVWWRRGNGYCPFVRFKRVFFKLRDARWIMPAEDIYRFQIDYALSLPAGRRFAVDPEWIAALTYFRAVLAVAQRMRA